MVHNQYRQAGGEDQSTAAEARLLRAAGHSVDLLEYDNREIDQLGSAAAGLRAVWSRPAVRDVAARLAGGRYDLLHVQNYFPLVSPAVLRVAASAQVATVQALRNYRLVCANAQNFRAGRTCHRCVGRAAPWAGVALACYRGSHLASLAPVAMVAAHRLLGTWSRKTDAFIAVSEVVRARSAAAGIPPERIFTRANVIEAPPVFLAARAARAVYAGRLAPEKGVDTLIAAWRLAAPPGSLDIYGDGPERARLERLAGGDRTIRFLGHVPLATVFAAVAHATVAVVPSLWEEPFGRSVVEAFAAGTPVLAAAIGGMASMLADGRGGALFPAGDVAALADHLGRYFTEPGLAAAAGRAARAKYEAEYAPARILAETEAIYRFAMARRAR